MGFFSFFVKKAPEAKAPDALLKAQAYDTTVAAPAPVVGTYPVAGNGPNVLDQLQRAARKRSEAQLSTVESEAPAPSIPRHKGTSSSRPNTAPTTNGKTERPKSSGRTSNRLSRAWPFLSEPRSPTSAHSAESQAPPVPSIAAYHYQETAVESPQSPGFVDILDAQGNIKPYSFRSRVQAVGARDYGEDVAERNLGGHGLAPRSSEANPFYKLARPDGSAVDVNGSSFLTDASDDDIDESAPPPVIAKGELSKEERANRARGLKVKEPPSSRSSSFNMASIKSISRADVTFERGETWRGIAEKRPETHHGARSSNLLEAPSLGPTRRRSLNAFVSTSTSSDHETKERGKPRPLSLHPSQSNFNMRSASPPPMPRHQKRPSFGSGQRPQSSLSNTGSHDSFHVPNQKNDESRPRTRHSKKTRSDFSGFSSPVSHSSRGSQRHSMRGSITSSSRRHSSPGGMPQGIGRVEIDSPADGDFDDAAPSPHIPSFSRHAEPQILSKPESVEDWSPHYGSARGEHSHPLTRQSSSASFNPARCRRRSVGGPPLPIPGRPRLDDITEHIPVRTSSLAVTTKNQPSLTSTPLSSLHSSNPFLRPSSEHTTNTSVDLSIPVPPLKFGPEIQPPTSRQRNDSVTSGFTVADEDDYMLDIKRAPPSQELDRKPSRKSSFVSHQEPPQTNLFEGFSAISDESDTDSFMFNQQRSTVGGEEGLLFNEGIYGGEGGGLPGLFDMFSGPHSPPLLETPTSLERPNVNTVSGRIQSHPHLRHSHSTPIYTQDEYEPSSEDDDSDMFSDFDYQLPRGRPIAKFPDLAREEKSAHRRRSAYGYIEEVEQGESKKGSKEMKRRSMQQMSHSKVSASNHRRYD